MLNHQPRLQKSTAEKHCQVSSSAWWAGRHKTDPSAFKFSSDCFSDKIISRKYLSSYWKMNIWKILELDFSASIHILQLNTVLTLWLRSLFFLAISENVFTKFCLFESTSDIYCCKDSRDQKRWMCSLQLETELVCWQEQYPKLENT